MYLEYFSIHFQKKKKIHENISSMYVISSAGVFFITPPYCSKDNHFLGYPLGMRTLTREHKPAS